MKRSGFTKGQIIAILRIEEDRGMAWGTIPPTRGSRSEGGRSLPRHGISGATFCAWKVNFGSMESSEAKRLKTPEDENARLKRLLAEAMLCDTTLTDLLSREWRRGAIVTCHWSEDAPNWRRRLKPIWRGRRRQARSRRSS